MATASTRLVIEPNRLGRQYWHDLWRYRELLGILAWRDVSVHYRQTFIGIAWAVIRPLLTVAVFVLVFGKVAKFAEVGEDYRLLVLAGMLPWQVFASSLAESSASLVGNANLVSKVYFPRMLVPMAATAVSLVDFVVTFPFLVGLMLYNADWPTWRMLLIPAILAWGWLAAIGLGLWLSALNVKYRDVRYMIPFVVQFGLYLSPVGYKSSIVPEQYQIYFALNPMVGVIECFRWCVLPNYATPDLWLLIANFVIVVALLTGGFWYFRRTEQLFADLI